MPLIRLMMKGTPRCCRDHGVRAVNQNEKEAEKRDQDRCLWPEGAFLHDKLRKEREEKEKQHRVRALKQNRVPEERPLGFRRLVAR